jgi:hypothetical protein
MLVRNWGFLYRENERGVGFVLQEDIGSFVFQKCKGHERKDCSCERIIVREYNGGKKDRWTR